MTYQQDNSGQDFSGSDNYSHGGGRGGFRGRRGGGNRFGGGFNRGPKPKIDVSALGIKCADCGVDIKELPFEPDPNRINTIRCIDCLRKNRPPRY